MKPHAGTSNLRDSVHAELCPHHWHGLEPGLESLALGKCIRLSLSVLVYEMRMSTLSL